MAAKQMPLYDPEDPRWADWRRYQRRARMEDEFYRAHYRYGKRDILARYIITPRERGLIQCGWTVLDTLVALIAVPALFGWVWLMCLAFAPIPS